MTYSNLNPLFLKYCCQSNLLLLHGNPFNELSATCWLVVGGSTICNGFCSAFSSRCISIWLISSCAVSWILRKSWISSEKSARSIWAAKNYSKNVNIFVLVKGPPDGIMKTETYSTFSRWLKQSTWKTCPQDKTQILSMSRLFLQITQPILTVWITNKIWFVRK